jgi:cyclophilin family peptidyl-prolyl cis-trans isomerase
MRRHVLLAIVWFTGMWPGVSSAQTLAQFQTPLGDMLVRLYDVDKPVTVQNFLRYVQSGAYQDMLTHRWVAGFVLQGGGFYTANRFGTNAIISAVPNFGAITNEYGVGRTFSNLYGTLAMARVGGQTNSANSQWFFNLVDNTYLDTVDGGFTVFGQVVLGTNVLNRFNNVSITNGIFELSLGAPLDHLPVLLTSPTNVPTYEDLVYMNITLPAMPQLRIVAAAGGSLELSWNSLPRFLNVVEWTTNLPPVWQTLVATNGTGGTMQTTDETGPGARRFYRLRLE